eukprot:8857152-Pyramimonas_sp.AAC.1
MGAKCFSTHRSPDLLPSPPCAHPFSPSPTPAPPHHAIVIAKRRHRRHHQSTTFVTCAWTSPSSTST